MKIYGGIFEKENAYKVMQEIDTELQNPTIWDSVEHSTQLLQKKARVQEHIQKQEKVQASIATIEEYLYFVNEGEHDAIDAFVESVYIAKKLIESMEVEMLFVKEEDKYGALVELHAGAGGKDAQDWTQMLARMYERFAVEKGYTVRCVDYLAGDEAGIKSITLEISGEYAYGLLQYERGIHRLIRISPFDSSGKRHTSFASVDILPSIEENTVIVIKESDLRIDTFRSSGPGGQSVNTTSSAVRITHIPTGITVQCQNERSQHANKESALRILQARLYRMEQEKIQEQKQSSYNSKDAINFGSQIRTYTLHPYMLVKDHRTNVESSDVEGILDGDITLFLESSLTFYRQSME